MKGHCGATIERRTDSWGWFGIGADMPLNGGGTMVSD